MKKFLLILFICSKIFGVFSAEENETDSSQEEESERKTHNDYSADSPPQFLQNPSVDWLQDQQGYLIKPVAASTDENVQYSSPKHQQMIPQIPSMQEPIIIEEGKKEANADKGKRPATDDDQLKFRDENEINKMNSQIFESSYPHVQNMSKQDQMTPYHHYYQQLQQQHSNQPIHHLGVGGTSHDYNLNPSQSSSHQPTFHAIPQFEEHSGIKEKEQHQQQFWQGHPVQGQQIGFHIPQLMQPHGIQSNYPLIHHIQQSMVPQGLPNSFPLIHHLPHFQTMYNLTGKNVGPLHSKKLHEQIRRDKKMELIEKLKKKITANCEEETRGPKLTDRTTFIAARKCIIKKERELVDLMSVVKVHPPLIGLFEHIRENHEDNQKELEFPNPLGLQFDHEEEKFEKGKLPITEEDSVKERNLKRNRKRRKEETEALSELLSTTPTFLLRKQNRQSKIEDSIYPSKRNY